MTEIAGIKFYTIQETAEALGVTPQTVRKYVKTGELKSKRVGKPILITEGNIREFVGLSEFLVKEEYFKLDEVEKAYYQKAQIGGALFYIAKDKASQIKELQRKLENK